MRFGGLTSWLKFDLKVKEAQCLCTPRLMSGQLFCGHEALEVTLVLFCSHEALEATLAGVHNFFELVGVPLNVVSPFLERSSQDQTVPCQ